MTTRCTRRCRRASGGPWLLPALGSLQRSICRCRSSRGFLPARNVFRHPAPSSVLPPVCLKIAGFGGQGVLLLGEVLAEAGLTAGLEVSWLPSYGPEMRSGTSNCHVRLSTRPIDSPLVSVPNVLLALNEPSLRNFIGTVYPSGWVIYNGTALPDDCARADVRTVVLPFTHLGDELGAAKAANIVMLGAL